MRFRNTTADVDAAIWDGTVPSTAIVKDYATNPGDVIDTDDIADLWDDEAGAYKLPDDTYVFAPHDERCLIVLTIEGRAIAAPGQWVLRYSDGSLHVMDSDEFVGTYSTL